MFLGVVRVVELGVRGVPDVVVFWVVGYYVVLVGEMLVMFLDLVVMLRMFLVC